MSFLWTLPLLVPLLLFGSITGATPPGPTQSRTSLPTQTCVDCGTSVPPLHVETDRLETLSTILGPDVIQKPGTPTSRPLNCSNGKLHPQQPGLSLYWAQEQTGADLLRDRLDKLRPPLSQSENKFLIWDTSDDQHAEKVSHLIQGPTPSALIPSDQPYPFDSFEFETAEALYKTRFENCETKNTCPHYLNRSGSWGRPFVKDIFQSISKKGTVVIAALGNSGKPLEHTDPFALEGAKNELALFVSNTGWTGRGYYNTNYSEYAAISAPAADDITSATGKSTPRQFSGTSASTPQVSAALRAFTLITGHPLSISEAKLLLKKTALPHIDYPEPNTLGAGILNTYRIGDLAFRAKELCSHGRSEKGSMRDSAIQQDSPSPCISQLIQSSDFYREPKTKLPPLESELARLFPSCAVHPQKPTVHDDSKAEHSCDQKIQFLDRIRSLTFLSPGEIRLWEMQGCIYSALGLIENAKYPIKVARKSSWTPDQKIEELLQYDLDDDVIKFILSHPTHQKSAEWTDRWLDQLIVRNKSDDLLKSFLDQSNIDNRYRQRLSQRLGRTVHISEVSPAFIREKLLLRPTP